MAICKHNTSKNGFAAAVEYLTSQHDAKGAILTDEDGLPVPREEYLINGINCLPETFAPLCLQDRLRFGKAAGGKTVDTHQYIISFAPGDAEKGLTMEEAQRVGLAVAKKNFPSHRVLVCTHPDGGKGSKNIHVHIVISSLRFQDREPDTRYMRLRPDDTVKPSEYRAGCAHQDTAALRQRLLAQLNGYCRERGYAVCPEKAADKIGQKEYLIKAKGIESRNDQLRRAIADAAQGTNSLEILQQKLRNDYTRMVPVHPPIPFSLRRNYWEEIKQSNAAFWSWDKAIRASYKDQLDEAFRELKTCKSKAARESIRRRITVLKEKQTKQRLFRETWQLYSRAASAALRSQNQDDAQLCLEQLRELTLQREGRWQTGWDPGVGTHSLVDGTAKSRVTWLQITDADRKMARMTLKAVQEEAQKRKEAAGKQKEVPMPIEVKLHRGELSFRHPDSQRWVRGKRLGDAYTRQSLGISVPQTKRYDKQRAMEHSRSIRGSTYV